MRMTCLAFLEMIMSLKSLFTEHPASVNETYIEHMGMSGSFAVTLFLAAGAATVHAILPFMFEKTASGMINKLHGRMVTNRVVKPTRTDGLVPAEKTA